jgi:rhodanese-related sulfurtransferase
MNDRVDLPQAREVCPTTTRRLIGEGALLVDVRERAEVAQVAFDVPDIVVMPLSELEQHFAELPRDRELVMVCQSGPRSLKATCFLMYQGYTRVANMEGGINKWASKGLPIKGARADNSATTAAATGDCCGTAAAAASCCETAPGTSAAAGACCSPASAGSGRCC